MGLKSLAGDHLLRALPPPEYSIPLLPPDLTWLQSSDRSIGVAVVHAARHDDTSKTCSSLSFPFFTMESDRPKGLEHSF